MSRAAGDTVWRVRWHDGRVWRSQLFIDGSHAVSAARLRQRAGAGVEVAVMTGTFEPATVTDVARPVDAGGRRVTLARVRWHYPSWAPTKAPSSRIMTSGAWARRFADRLEAKGAVVELSKADTPIAWVPPANDQ